MACVLKKQKFYLSCVLISAFLLAGCGMKGPLMLPDQKSPTKAAPMRSPLDPSSTDEDTGAGHR